MRSATSFFNKTLFRNQLLRTWPLWLAYTAVWLFIVPITLFTESSARQGRYDAADAADFLLNAGARGGIFMAFGFGLLFAMLSFSYLTKGRATNGYHALPVRRETLFSTAYLTGLFCQIVSILLAFLLGAAVASPFHLSFTSVTGAAMLAAMLETVFYYSFAVLCVMMTGQMLAAPAFYVIGNFLAIAMESLVRSFAGNFLFGYAASGTVQLGFLSPLYWMNRKVNINYDHTYVESTGDIISSNAHCDPASLRMLAAYAIAGLVIAVIALLLYRTRKSELTGSTVAFSWAAPVFKYGVAFCTAIAPGQLLYYLLFGQYQPSGHYSLPGTIVCMVIAGLLGYYIAEMLIRKSFHVFRAGAKGAAIVAGVLVLLGVSMTFDLTGYENRVPDESDVEAVYYTFGGTTHVVTGDRDAIRYLLAAHRAIADNKNEQMQLLRVPTSASVEMSGEDDTSDQRQFSLEISYYLYNGTQLTRRYDICLDKNDLPDPTSVTGRVNALYMCKTSAMRRILGYGYERLGDDPHFLDGICYYYNSDSGMQDYSLTPEQIDTVYAAILRDAQNADGSSGNIFTVQEYAYNATAFSLELFYESTDDKGRPDVDSYSIDVNENTPITMETLNELLPTLKRDTATPPADDSIITLPADDAGSAEGVN